MAQENVHDQMAMPEEEHHTITQSRKQDDLATDGKVEITPCNQVAELRTNQDSQETFLAGSMSMHSDNDFVEFEGKSVPDTLCVDTDDDDEEYIDTEDDDIENTVSSDGSMSGNSDLDGDDRKGRVVARLQSKQQRKTEIDGANDNRNSPIRNSSRHGRLKANRSKTFSTDSLLQGDCGRQLREERRTSARRTVGSDGNANSPEKADIAVVPTPHHRIVEVPKTDALLKAVTAAMRNSSLDDNVHDELDVRLHKGGLEVELSPHGSSQLIQSESDRYSNDAFPGFSGVEVDTVKTYNQQRGDQSKQYENDDGRNMDGDGSMSDHSDLDGDDRKGRVVSRLKPKEYEPTNSSGERINGNEPPSRLGRLKANRGNNLSTDSLLEGDFGRKLREERRICSRRSGDAEGNPKSSDRETKMPTEETKSNAHPRPYHRIVEVPKSDLLLKAATNAKQTTNCDDEVYDELDVPLYKGESNAGVSQRQSSQIS